MGFNPIINRFFFLLPLHVLVALWKALTSNMHRHVISSLFFLSPLHITPGLFPQTSSQKTSDFSKTFQEKNFKTFN